MWVGCWDCTQALCKSSKSSYRRPSLSPTEMTLQSLPMEFLSEQSLEGCFGFMQPKQRKTRSVHEGLRDKALLPFQRTQAEHSVPSLHARTSCRCPTPTSGLHSLYTPVAHICMTNAHRYISKLRINLQQKRKMQISYLQFGTQIGQKGRKREEGRKRGREKRKEVGFWFGLVWFYMQFCVYLRVGCLWYSICKGRRTVLGTVPSMWGLGIELSKPLSPMVGTLSY